MSGEKHEFKAEVAALLGLVTNSLYTHSEIFLRELISNASDALDKARFAALVEDDIEGKDIPPQILITADHTRGVLVIEDTGIGMTQAEAEQNLGTIAHRSNKSFNFDGAKLVADVPEAQQYVKQPMRAPWML